MTRKQEVRKLGKIKYKIELSFIDLTSVLTALDIVKKLSRKRGDKLIAQRVHNRIEKQAIKQGRKKLK